MGPAAPGPAALAVMAFAGAVAVAELLGLVAALHGLRLVVEATLVPGRAALRDAAQARLAHLPALDAAQAERRVRADLPGRAALGPAALLLGARNAHAALAGLTLGAAVVAAQLLHRAGDVGRALADLALEAARIGAAKRGRAAKSAVAAAFVGRRAAVAAARPGLTGGRVAAVDVPGCRAQLVAARAVLLRGRPRRGRAQPGEGRGEDHAGAEPQRAATGHRLRQRAGQVVEAVRAHVARCLPFAARGPASASTAAAPAASGEATRPSRSTSTAIGVPAAPNAAPASISGSCTTALVNPSARVACASPDDTTTRRGASSGASRSHASTRPASSRRTRTAGSRTARATCARRRPGPPARDRGRAGPDRAPACPGPAQ